MHIHTQVYFHSFCFLLFFFFLPRDPFAALSDPLALRPTSRKSCSKCRSCRHCSSFSWCLDQNCSKAFSVSSSWARSLRRQGYAQQGHWRSKCNTHCGANGSSPLHRGLIFQLVRAQLVLLRLAGLLFDAGQQGGALLQRQLQFVLVKRNIIVLTSSSCSHTKNRIS